MTALAVQQNHSLSQVINRFIQIGMYHLDGDRAQLILPVEQHYQQLIIQMNALIKNMFVEILKFEQADFDALRQASVKKHDELIGK